jgi:hypothetical protein
MITGSLFFVGEGVAMFRNRLMVESLSPIMQKTKRTKVRTIHYAIMFAGGCFMLLGVCFIFLAKHTKGESTIPRSAHALLGTTAVIVVVLQGFAGEQKIEDIETKQSIPGRSKHSWHADLGMVLWDLLICTLSTGVYHLVGFTKMYAIMQVIFIFTWASVHLQMKRKGPEGSQLSAFAEANDTPINSPTQAEQMDPTSQTPFLDEENAGVTTEMMGSETENPHLV